MPKNNRYIAGFIKTISGQVDLKWKIRPGWGNKSFTKPVKKLNKRIKLFNK